MEIDEEEIKEYLSDLNEDYADSYEALTYGKVPWLQLRSFFSKKNFSGSDVRLLNFNDDKSRYNSDLYLVKIFNLYKNLDDVLVDMVNTGRFYPLVVKLISSMGIDSRPIDYINLCRNWDYILGDFLYSFESDLHRSQDSTNGFSYYTYFNAFSRELFHNIYIEHKVKSQNKPNVKTYRLSWIPEDFEYTLESEESNHLRMYCDPLENYINDYELKTVERLYQHQAESQLTLTKC